MGEEELKWHQLAHNQHKDLILVHTVQLKPGKFACSGISDVAFTSVYSEKTQSEEVDNYYYNRKTIY